MTEIEIRNQVIELSEKYKGLSMGDERHRDIVDTYNTLRPLPRGYRVTYTNDYCATFVTAILMKMGMVDLIGGECGCGELINLARERKTFYPRTYMPKKGDIIMYDYKPDEWADHTGFVISCDGNIVTSIEGNVGGDLHTVDYRSIGFYDKRILGYIAPDYASKATPGKEYNKNPLGIAVAKEFLNTKAYPGDDAPAGYFTLGTNRQDALGAGNQTDFYDSDYDTNGKKWLLIGIFGQKVWAEAEKMDVKLYNTDPQVGDRIRFVGDKLHTSSYLLSRGVPVKQFTGVLERIYEGRAYPYYVRADGNITDGFCKKEDLEKL